MRRLIFLLAVCLMPGRSRRGPGPGRRKGFKSEPASSALRAQQGSRREFQPRYPDRPEPAQETTPRTIPTAPCPAEDADENASGDVQEFHPFDPHRAAKDIEVGDFYFKKKNYGAALDRYREALFYKPNDASANFRMAQAFEKLARLDEAAEHYQEYLKILPNGPQAEEAKKALEKIKASPPSEKTQAKQ